MEIRKLLYERLVVFQTIGQQAVVVSYADDIVTSTVVEADVPIIYHVNGSTIPLIAIVADT
jgi:hypothetical protein